MGPQHEGTGLGCLSEHAAARRARFVHVEVTDLGQLRLGALDRVMQEVPTDQRALARRLDPQRDMPWRMPGRRLQAQTVAEVRVFGDDIRQAGRDDRRDRVDVDPFDARVVIGAAVLELAGGVEVACVGERREPLTIHEMRSPADVVRVQVRVHDRVDGRDLEARIREPLEERPGHLVPEREWPLLPVPDARVHEHAPRARLDDDGLHAQRDVPLLVRVVRDQRRMAKHVRGGGIREEELRWDVRCLVLEDARDRRVPHLPALRHAVEDGTRTGSAPLFVRTATRDTLRRPGQRLEPGVPDRTTALVTAAVRAIGQLGLRALDVGQQLLELLVCAHARQLLGRDVRRVTRPLPELDHAEVIRRLGQPFELHPNRGGALGQHPGDGIELGVGHGSIVSHSTGFRPPGSDGPAVSIVRRTRSRSARPGIRLI